MNSAQRLGLQQYNKRMGREADMLASRPRNGLRYEKAISINQTRARATVSIQSIIEANNSEFLLYDPDFRDKMHRASMLLNKLGIDA